MVEGGRERDFTRGTEFTLVPRGIPSKIGGIPSYSLLMSWFLVIIFKSGYLVWSPYFFDDSVVPRGNTKNPACYL